MANSFNVVTALQTIHEHTHAVGFGCIPSDWTTGDPAAFCEVNNLFVPGLAAWFFDTVCRPFGYGSCERHISLPHCIWGVRKHKTGNGWSWYFSCGPHRLFDVMEIMEMGGEKREVRFFFRRNPEALLGALWCLNMMGRKRYTELAYLFEYEGKERLVFKVTASALVHVQLLVECFRRAGILPQGFGLGWRNLACDNKLGKPLFMSDTNLVWRSPTNPEQWVEMCQLMDADLSDRKVLMPTTGESLYFSLCRGNIVVGDDSFYLSFAVNGRTMSVDTVRCTMWDLL